MAKATVEPKNSGGSPMALEENIARSLGALCSKDTLKSTGVSLNVGGLYVPADCDQKFAFKVKAKDKAGSSYQARE